MASCGDCAQEVINATVDEAIAALDRRTSGGDACWLLVPKAFTLALAGCFGMPGSATVHVASRA
eukprot:5099741-Pyramimonas_sp.AAC.1